MTRTKRQREGPVSAGQSSASNTPIPALGGHPETVTCVLVLPASHVIVTACRDGFVRLFAPNGLGGCLRAFEAHSGGVSSLASLGGGVIVSCASGSPAVATWRAFSGELLERTTLEGRQYGVFSKLLAVKKGFFVAAVLNGFLALFFHEDGRNVRITSVESLGGSGAGGEQITDISVVGDVIAVSRKLPGVTLFSTSTFKTVTVLVKPGERVLSAAGGKKYLATGSSIGTVRVYRNNEAYPFVRWHEGFHLNSVRLVEFVGPDLIVSVSTGAVFGRSRICFTRLPEGKPLCLEVPLYDILSFAVTGDGRLACAGEGRTNDHCHRRASIILPPPKVRHTFKVVAVRLLAPPPSGLRATVPTPAAPETSLARPTNFLPVETAVEISTAAPILNVAPVAMAPGCGGGAKAEGCEDDGGDGDNGKHLTAQSLVADLHPEHRTDLKALKALSLQTDVLESMTIEALSEVVAAAMIGFQDEFLLQFPILACCLRSAFRINGIAGDMIVSFPVAKLLKNILDTLHKDADYLKCNETLISSFEWRLERLLHNLRLKPV